ncbi:MAG: DUF992 domain-containing protein [Pseudomonadota bacterium]
MKSTTLLAAAAVTVLSTSAAFAQGVEVGLLTCELTDVSNNIVYSKEEFTCNFAPAEGDPELYIGQIKSYGLDLQVKQDFTIVWGVVAPARFAKLPGALSGTYVGGSAEVSLGAGMGAKILVGGSENSISLQPVSVSGIVGAGASLGVQSFELK